MLKNATINNTHQYLREESEVREPRRYSNLISVRQGDDLLLQKGLLYHLLRILSVGSRNHWTVQARL